jgi:hypothetical protein
MIGAFGLARPLDRRVQLRPVIVSAALGLGEGLDQVERLGLGKPGDCRALHLEAEPRAPLPRRRDSDVADCFPQHPRWTCAHASFQDWCLKPLGHPSTASTKLARHWHGGLLRGQKPFHCK